MKIRPFHEYTSQICKSIHKEFDISDTIWLHFVTISRVVSYNMDTAVLVHLMLLSLSHW